MLRLDDHFVRGLARLMEDLPPGKLHFFDASRALDLYHKRCYVVLGQEANGGLSLCLAIISAHGLSQALEEQSGVITLSPLTPLNQEIVRAYSNTLQDLCLEHRLDPQKVISAIQECCLGFTSHALPG